jgi:hypothetical protein
MPALALVNRDGISVQDHAQIAVEDMVLNTFVDGSIHGYSHARVFIVTNVELLGWSKTSMGLPT